MNKRIVVAVFLLSLICFGCITETTDTSAMPFVIGDAPIMNVSEDGGTDAPSQAIACTTHDDCVAPGQCLAAYCVNSECTVLSAPAGTACDGGMCRNGACEAIVDTCTASDEWHHCELSAKWAGNCMNGACCSSCIGWSDGAECLFDAALSEAGSCSGGLCCKDGLCQQTLCN